MLSVLVRSPSLPLSLSLFLFFLSVRYLFVSADALRFGKTLKTESLKQPHLDTQLTHSQLFSS